MSETPGSESDKDNDDLPTFKFISNQDLLESMQPPSAEESRQAFLSYHVSPPALAKSHGIELKKHEKLVCG